MTAVRKRWQRSAAIAAMGATAFLGTAIAAAPAQAHSPGFDVDCSTVSVDLTNYNEQVDNTVKITVDGKDLLAEQTFKREFHKKLDLPEHKDEVTVRLVVNAGDDDKFSRDEEKTAPACEETEPPAPTPSETENPSTPPSSEAPAPPASEQPSSSAPAAAPQQGGDSADLAETGSSNSTPMLAGIAAAVVIIGGVLLAVTRKRRSARG
ncbi:LAETG motif-containing sortase-dependent surface protein [Streptomyces xiaopingdaonensis]|uniref:LAETG motif-containing sortase-dependent surface protein n=1 Tax=Streptomyces xiaopingdaonensis TaxID=1565415 RepID=UPI000315428B|nr:LAETG motif-containing sortase-dependent surface protein [Streptomyces xiaopingdaonensis]